MRLIIAANRAPYVVKKKRNVIKVERSPGGLVSALDPIMQRKKGIWVCTCRDDNFFDVEFPYEIRHIKLSSQENYHYYEGFGNRQIWPLFHYLPARYMFHEKDWEFYIKVNQKFANQIFSFVKPDDVIWIHDYHLMLVPNMLRKIGVNNKIGFFMHIPFPSYEVFRITPKRKFLLDGLLGADVIAFHTESYQSHFMDCVKRKMNMAEIDSINGQIHHNNRIIDIPALPISIDFAHIESTASRNSVRYKAKKLKNMFNVDVIGLGVDRLDYTKGIFERLNGIEYFLDTHPEYQGKFLFIQIAVPSRTKVLEYQKIKKEVDEAVGRINGKFSKDGWSPISYIYNSVSFEDLVTYYSCADFALITALRDGLNLVTKEYIASRINNDGMLILSEFAGAAEELDTGNIINPFDIRSISNGILRSIKMSGEEKQRIMIKLRQQVREKDVYKWVDDFLCRL
jgi:alpha,alpha-trehalose-phosphate synthase [UDP-forming]